MSIFTNLLVNGQNKYSALNNTYTGYVSSNTLFLLYITLFLRRGMSLSKLHTEYSHFWQLPHVLNVTENLSIFV